MDLFDAMHVELHTGPDFCAELSLKKDIAATHEKSETLHICGVDEVGRGPLAGPVVAAAVILNPARVPEGLNDSKKLTQKRREALNDVIFAEAIAVSVAEASVAEIDEINILQASMLAMRRAVKGLSVTPHGALVDGNRDPDLADLPTRTLIKGDARSLSIAAASIVAKVFRDRLMAELDKSEPAYGWAQNAGYGVPKHLNALSLVGVSSHHRRSFAPIRDILDEE